MKKLLYFFVFILISYPAESHVNHYKNIKFIYFELYRNNNLIGFHNYDFTKNKDILEVKSVIDFKIEKLGVTLYRYHAKGVEKYKDNQLISFESKTRQNKKDKFCRIFLKDDKFFIEGSSYQGEAPDNFIIGTWWNHSIIDKKSQVSAISGRIINQKVTFIGKERLIINGDEINTLHFNFSSTDEKLSKNKKLNTDVWYEEGSMNWIKASFDRQGKWEYRLKKIEFYK